MNLKYVLAGFCVVVSLTGCVFVTMDDTLPLTGVSDASMKKRAERINLSVALDCRPTCAFVGTDLAATTRAIVSEYRRSGRFTVTPSDDVSRVAEVKVSIVQEDGWLAPPFCERTFGLLPGSWRHRVRMVTTLSGREGVVPHRSEYEAEVNHYCHLVLLPWGPFSADPGALDRTVGGLAYRSALEVAQ